jgi:hypothetical protein
MVAARCPVKPVVVDAEWMRREVQSYRRDDDWGPGTSWRGEPLRIMAKPLPPLPADCRCFSCTASDVGRVVKWAVLFVVVASFVVLVLG